MRKGEATRARILDEAARQAAARGLEAVSLADVAEAVGLSKSGLFKHFDSKEEMQLGALETVWDRLIAHCWEPAAPLPSGRPRLEMIFDLWLAWADEVCAETGCLLVTAGVELDDKPGPLRDYMQARLLAWRARLAEEMKRLRDPPLSDDEARAAVFQMRSFVLGHTDAVRMLGDADARAVARDAFRALLERVERAAPAGT